MVSVKENSDENLPPKYQANESEEGSVVEESKKRGGCLGCLHENLFMICILAGVLVGFALGFGLKAANPSQDAIVWIEMPGKIYIRLLQLTILPLIASNLIVVIARLDPKEQGTSSLLIMAYIITFNALGAAIGCVLSTVIKPGASVTTPAPSGQEYDQNLTLTTSDVFEDLILNMFPDNIIGMCIFQTRTQYRYKFANRTGKIQEKVNNPSTNLIGVLLVSIAFGIAARKAGDQGRAFLELFKSVTEVVLKLVRACLLATPVGIAFMIAGAILRVGDIKTTFTSLGMFVVTVTASLGILFFCCVGLFAIVTRRNPFTVLRVSLKAWVISFATTSPIVSIPEMFAGCDDYNMDQSTSRFACPLASALKADGPAAFIACAALFVAQTESTSISPGSIVVIW
uniref:Amino acid transporter n=1 Tax=Schistocephalus solidus TaxID=70667 RepID=A0A0X3NW87_SCHSO